jgi:hypothetical protein
MWSRLQSQLANVLDGLLGLAVGLVEAIVVIVLALYLHRFVRDRLLRRFDSPGQPESRRAAVGIMTTVVVAVATATVLLAMWGATWSGIITAISLGTLGILLGVQDVLKSLIGGLFLILEQPYAIGDRISVRDVTGRVIGIELRTTILRSDDGHRIVAPNSIVFTDTMTNYSLRRQIQTNLILTDVSGDPAQVRSRIEQAVVGVAGPVEVRLQARRPRPRVPFLERLVGAKGGDPSASHGLDVWISWLGGGEPEVQDAVVARLHELYPNASVRARNVWGIEVPPRTRAGGTPR